MTTKENVRRKVVEMLDDIRPHLEKKLDYLLDSGAIDFENTENNYLVPKNIMQALAREMEYQYKNICADRKDKKQINDFYTITRTAFL